MFRSTLYLLRHGQLQQQNILCGYSDIALSELGKAQLINATKDLVDIHHCFSSPLSRCYSFAQQFSQQARIPLTSLAELKEMNFGDWDGAEYASLWQQDEGVNTSIGDFWQEPWRVTPPNGESMQAFNDRIEFAWQQVLEQAKQGNVLVVTHGGVIRQVLAQLLAIPKSGNHALTAFDIPYASLVKIVVDVDEQGKT